MYAAFNGITAPKRLVLTLEIGHVRLMPEHEAVISSWLQRQVGAAK
jgi:hypothetical protein